jgi:hypothetical protein
MPAGGVPAGSPAATAAAAGAASAATWAGPVTSRAGRFSSTVSRSSPFTISSPGHPRKATIVLTTTSSRTDEAISSVVVPRLAM